MEPIVYLKLYTEEEISIIMQALSRYMYNNPNVTEEQWENANRPTTVEGISNHCRKCKSIDHCINYAMHHPNDMIRCPCYGLLKLCVERSRDE